MSGCVYAVGGSSSLDGTDEIYDSRDDSDTGSHSSRLSYCSNYSRSYSRQHSRHGYSRQRSNECYDPNTDTWSKREAMMEQREGAGKIKDTI